MGPNSPSINDLVYTSLYGSSPTPNSPSLNDLAYRLAAGAKVYNVLARGAKGDGIADDTTVLNSTLKAAGLAGGGLVYGPPGNFLISAPLVIYSFTKLELDPACTITLAPGSNCNMLNNLGRNPQRTVSDAITTASSTTVTSATASFTSADVGSSVVLGYIGQGNGAGISGQTFVTTIVSVTNATTIVVALAPSTSVNPTKLEIYRRDSFIEICGGSWNRQNNADNGHMFGDNFSVEHLDYFSIHDLYYTASGGKNSIHMGDITKFSVENIRFKFAATIAGGIMDGVHIIGPASQGYVDNIQGTTDDDFVAITAADAASIGDIAGDVTDISINNMISDGAWNGLKIISGTGVKVRDVTVRNIKGKYASVPVYIMDDGTGPTDVDGLVIDGVDATPGGSNPMIHLSPSAGKTITLRNLNYPSSIGGVAAIFCTQGNGSPCSIVRLVVDGMSLPAGVNNTFLSLNNGTIQSLEMSHLVLENTAATVQSVVAVASGKTINNLVMTDSTFIQSTNSHPLVDCSGTINFFSADNIYMNGGMLALITESGSTVPTVQLSNMKMLSVYDLAVLRTTTDLTLSNIYITCSQPHLLSLIGAGAVISVRGSGLINPNSTDGIARDGTQTPRVVMAELPVDLSILAKNNGDIAYNTNAGLACGVGVAISNGSNWKNIYTASVF